MCPEKQVLKQTEVEVTYLLDDVQVNAVSPTGEPQVQHKLARHDCGKQVSAKRLKYGHGPNCAVKKQKQSLPTITREDGIHSLGVKATKEQEYQSRMRNRRMEHTTRREKMVLKLKRNAFP